MATITVTDELDVASKYNTLVTQSLSGDSAYIRAKETIDELVKDGSIADSQKAEIISSIIGNISSTITTASMSTAMQWASAEKEIALKKLELAKQLDILDKDVLLKDAQIDQAVNATRLAKVESRRVHGVATFDSEDNILSLDSTGKVSQDMLLVEEQVTKVTAEISQVEEAVKLAKTESRRMHGSATFDGSGDILTIDATGKVSKDIDLVTEQISKISTEVSNMDSAMRLSKVESRRMYGSATFDGSGDIITLDSTGKVSGEIDLIAEQTSKATAEVGLVTQKVVESHAAVHKIVADTYVNYGNYTYTGVTATGITGITAHHLPAHKTLSETQKDIAIEQAKGYVYNAWANALTGSSSMLGTALASGLAEFDDDENGNPKTGKELLVTVLDVAKSLQAATTTADEAEPYVPTA
jgi:hypothetical protein